jgi:hypothetical protein
VQKSALAPIVTLPVLEPCVAAVNVIFITQLAPVAKVVLLVQVATAYLDSREVIKKHAQRCSGKHHLLIIKLVNNPYKTFCASPQKV